MKNSTTVIYASELDQEAIDGLVNIGKKYQPEENEPFTIEFKFDAAGMRKYAILNPGEISPEELNKFDLYNYKEYHHIIEFRGDLTPGGQTIKYLV